jgi:hypothetical protein
VSKNCDNLITLVHYNELSLLLGYEEIKNKTKEILDWALIKVLDFDLEDIYMYCVVNCIENSYIANYIKTRESIEDEENTNEGEEVPQYPPIFSYDESGNEEALFIQPISPIKSTKNLTKPTHHVVKKKKKRRKSRGKKVSLPSNVSPITIVPHESESNMLMGDDDIEYDFVMPTTCCDDYD